MQELFGYKIYEYDSLESTNTLLFERAKQGEKDKTVVIARSQTGGRGRRGKSFYSPKGTGLYMSVLMRKGVLLDSLNYLTPAVAVACVHAIERVCGKTCGIKWVNDIYIEGKKAAGILTETKCDFEKGILNYAVIGIGINLTAPKGGFPDEIKNTASAIFDECDEALRLALLQEVLLELDEILADFNPNRFMDEYKQRSILDGKQIEIITNDGTLPATAICIDDEARLIIKTSQGVLALSSGEVSVKL
ncbi:MAG: biotin--[Oscillospiraceae bacterium]|nr:biotin--[acetyl-CoA-carboxylase] ligase [Oscillospiraceae bacterium]